MYPASAGAHNSFPVRAATKAKTHVPDVGLEPTTSSRGSSSIRPHGRSHSCCALALAAPIICTAALVPRTGCRDCSAQNTRARKTMPRGQRVDTLEIEPRASRMLSGCGTTSPCGLRRRCCARFVLQARVGQRLPPSQPTRRQAVLHERSHTRWRSWGPHRLVVRTSRCGRDNPCSSPGVDIFARPATAPHQQGPRRCAGLLVVPGCGCGRLPQRSYAVFNVLGT